MYGRGGVVPLVMLALVTACAGQRQADAAFREAEQQITEQHTQAIRYAPDAFKQVMATYDSARQHYLDGDYRQAIAGAKRTLALAEELPGVVGTGRRAATEEWQSVSEEVNVLLGDLENRVTALQKTRRLPGGIRAEDVAQARDELPELRSMFAESDRTFREGKVAEAVHVASQVRAKADSLAEALELAAGRRSEP